VSNRAGALKQLFQRYTRLTTSKRSVGSSYAVPVNSFVILLMGVSLTALPCGKKRSVEKRTEPIKGA